MRDPSLINKVEYNGESVTIITINPDIKYDIEDYDLFDPKEFGKYINSIERICRTSYEYREMISYLRQNINMNKCSFYENVNNIDSFKIKIEIHHEPLCLYDICQVIYNKRLALGELLDEEMVAKEVMFVHYNNLVGLISLSETVHELVHNNYLFVPTDKVYGQYKKFISLYEKYIPMELFDKLERIEEVTKTYQGDIDNNILEKKYVYLDVTGSYELPNYQHIISLMDQRIKEIKNNYSNNNNIVKRNTPFTYTKKEVL